MPLLIPFSTIGSAKAEPSPYWVSIYGSETDISNPYGFEASQGIAVDSQGNSYIAGYGYPDYDADSDPTGLLVKLDPFGQVIYQKGFKESGFAECHLLGVEVDSNDDVLVNASIGGGSFPDFISNFVMMKLDSSGNILWQKEAGNGSTDYFTNFHQNNDGVDGSNNFYTAFEFRNFDTNEYKYYLTKMTSSGSTSWIKELSNSNEGFYDKLDVDSSGNVFTGFDVAAGGSFTNAKAMLTKLNSSGSLLWSKQMYIAQDFVAEEDAFTQIIDIAADNAGGAVVAGYYSDSNQTESEIFGFLMKFDSNGNTTWQTKLPGLYMRSVAVAPTGNIYTYSDEVYGNDLKFVTKFNSSGTIQWHRNLEGVDPGFNTDLKLDVNENIYLGMSYFDDPSGRKNAMVVVKLPPDGSLTGNHGFVSYAAASITQSSISYIYNNSPTTVSNAPFSYSNASFTVSTPTIESDRINIK